MRRRPPTWRDLHPGDDARVEAMQFARYREVSPRRKMRMLRDLNAMARRFALAGLAQRHPGASPDELRRRLADLLLGPDLAERVYGPLPG